MGLVFVPVYIRYLGMEAYGLIGIFALLQTWLSLLDMGMTAALSREFSRSQADDTQALRDLLRSVELVAAAMAGLVILILYASADWIVAAWLQVERLPLSVVAQAVSLIGVVAGLRILENIYRSSLLGMQRQVTLNVIVSVAATLRGAGAVAVLAWWSPTVISYFLWQALISILTIAVSAWMVYKDLPPGRGGRFSSQQVQKVWRFAAGTSLLTVLGMALSQTDKVILSKLLPLDEFAGYTLAFTVAGSIRLLTQPIDLSIYPRLTQLMAAKDERGAARLYHKAAQVSAVLMGSATALLVVMGQELLQVWTNDAELAAHVYPVMAVLAVGMLGNGLMNGPYYLQMAVGWTGLLVRANAVMLVFFLPLVYVLTSRAGAIGAALAWLALNSAYLGIVVPLMHRRVLGPEMWRWYLSDLAAPLCAATAVLLALKWLQPPADNRIFATVFLAVAFVSALFLSVTFARDLRQEVAMRLGGWSQKLRHR